MKFVLSAIQALSLVLLSLSSLSTVAAAQSRVVVVIPGTMGSKLCDKQGKVAWGDRYSYTAERLKQIRLPYSFDPEKLEHTACGLIEQINVIPVFWESNVYNGLLASLESLGYSNGGDCAKSKGGNLIQFSYDWRLSNFHTANKLKDCVEKIRQKTDKKIDLVAHSMGGVVARLYIQQLGGDRHIHNLITLGTPHRGSAKVFQRLTEGLENWPDALSGGLLEIQRTTLSFPSTYQLLPSYEKCCAFSSSGGYQDAEYFSAFDPDAWSKFSWLPPELRKPQGEEFLGSMLKEAKSLAQLLEKPIFLDSTRRPQAITVANGFLHTWSRVYFDPNSGKVSGHTEKPGDKTVLLFSATNGDPSQVRVSNKEHEQVFAGREPELVLKAALSDTQWTKGAGTFGRELKDSQDKRYFLHSIGYDAGPRILLPSQVGTFEIVLRGDARLKSADLTKVSVSLRARESNEKVLSVATDVKEQQGDQIIRKITFSYKAPELDGPHQLQLSIPGLNTHDQLILVMKP